LLAEALPWIAIVLGAYLLGSTPSAYLVTRWVARKDIRRIGDLNSGAANVFRTVGRTAGMIVFLVDLAKGAVAIALAWILAGTLWPYWGMAAAASAIAGHNWPVYLRFRGGRGAATAAGALLALFPALAVPLSLLGIVALLLTRNATKALACLFIPLPLLTWPLGYSAPQIACAFGLPILVGVSHFLSVRRKPLPAPGHSPQG